MSKISAYAALSSLPETMRFVGTDTGNTSMAASGTTKTAAPAVMLLPLQPTGDVTGTKDSANIAAAMAAGRPLAPGTFYVSNLTIGSYQQLAGSGPSTILEPVSGTTGYVLALASGSVVQAVIRNLTINCNGVCGGILINNTSSPYPDPLHLLCDLLVLNATGDGYHFTASHENRVSRCKQYGATGYGFYIDTNLTDSRFTDCSSGVSGLHGFYVAGWNNNFSGCKAFYAGSASSVFDTTHSGWYLTACHCCTFTGCSGQQNALHGMDMESAVNCTVAACEFDNNSCGSATTGSGVNIDASTYCIIMGCTGANDGSLSPGGNQTYGFSVTGTLTGTMIFANSVTGITEQFHYVSGGSYTLLQQAYTDLSQVETFLTPTLTLGATSSEYSAPIITGIGSVSGTAKQLSDKARDYIVYLDCTTAGTATTISIGSTSAASDVTIMSSAAISAGIVSFRLPAAWYFKWSGTTTAFGTQTAVGC